MEFDTIHQMYEHLFETRPTLPAHHVKQGRQWKAVTWRQYEHRMRGFALGLLALGMDYRDPVTILGRTREEWDLADKAALSAGGISVGCYHSNSPTQLLHVVRHSESRFLVFEDKEQWEKILKIRKDLTGVKAYIAMDPRGIEDPDVSAFSDVIELGHRERTRHEETFKERFSSVRADDTAILFYTSGTTGPPKAAMLTHRNVLEACKSMWDAEVFSAQDVTVIWLPMPHIYGRIAQIAGTYSGVQAYYAEALDKVVENLREIRPTLFYGVPRIFEKVYSRVTREVRESPILKRRMFTWCLEVGRARSRLLQARRPVPLSVELRYRIADRLALRRIRGVFGDRIRVVLSGGAPISREILEFFHAAGILPLELYGITECLLCTINQPQRYRFGSVGPPAPGVEIRVADDGEILVKSPMIFRGYLKDEERTREVFTGDGWFATGDIGTVDRDGFVWITDRKKDILITAGGKNVAPQKIENLLESSPYISQAMVYGDRKPYLTALIIPDREEIGKWASSEGLPARDYPGLCEDPRVYELIRSVIEEKNQELARYEQIKRFRILPKEFSQDDGTLTATLKVRRLEVIKRYGDLLESLYSP